MAEALAVSASVVGIVVPALHSIRLLQDDIKRIIDAPAAIGSLKDDLANLDATLESLKAVEKTEWTSLGSTVATQCEIAIRTCDEACKTFNGDLQRWTRRSQGGKLAWRDRAKIGFFKESQIKSMSHHLQNCKLTCGNVVGMATLYSSIRMGKITEEIKHTILQKEADIGALSKTTDIRLADVDNSLADMRLNNQDNQDEMESDERISTIAQLEEELVALKASQALILELLSQMKEDKIERPAREQKMSANISFGDHNSGFQMGVGHGAISGLTFGKPS